MAEGQVDEGAVKDEEVARDLQNQELEQGGEGSTAVPEFDPSKVDLTDADQIASLSDEQLAELEKYNLEHPVPEPGAAGQAVTPGKETTDTSKGVTAEKPEAGATKYAGKYATPDALFDGVREIAGKLGYSSGVFQAMLDAAKASGETKSIEALYKTLETQLSEKGAAPVSEGANPATVPAKDTPSADTFNPADPQVNAAVDRLTQSQIASSTLAKRMADRGLPLPTSMEEFDKLAEQNPYFAMEFKQVYTELWKDNMAQAKGFFEAKRTVDSANASVVDTDVQAIKKMATDEGFTLTDAEVAAVKSAALADPRSYETRFGHKFLVKDAVREYFLVHTLPGKIKEIGLAKETNGRQQAITDMAKAGKREIRGLGTSRLGSRQRAVQKMPDLNDPDVIASLPDEALADPEGYFRRQGFTK